LKLLHGDCLELLKTLPAASVDSFVTDPPYGLKFMGKNWDAGIPGVVFWEAALRVAKPGAFLLAFGGTRTFHRLACAIEDAGWELRDCCMWVYGSGFPKSQSCLKPGWEPIILAKAPGSLRPLGIDACRIGAELIACHGGGVNGDGRKYGGGQGIPAVATGSNPHLGRWPANVILSHAPECVEVGERKVKGNNIFRTTGSENGVMSAQGVNKYHRTGRKDIGEEVGYADADGTETIPLYACVPGCPVRMLDEQSGTLKSGKMKPGQLRKASRRGLGGGYGGGLPDISTLTGTYGDQGGASRFFYCPKASRSERNAGLEGMPEQPAGVMDDDAYVWPKNGDGSPRNKKVQPRANIHPTVKPLALTQWLCRLITPLGGTVCDPFMGSGTTGKASLAEGFGFIGMELDAGYFEIAGARIAAAQADAPLFAG